jgi:succinate dehydrogenase / fumarate reductase membrane anchor subunit
MTFMTDRKRAIGTGSAKSGTLSHWHMMISSVAMLLLLPIFIFQFGNRIFHLICAVTSKTS